MSRVGSVRRAMILLLLALWWGGFSFYAGRVVFIGHQVLGSSLRQGFITERVTTELNWLGIAALLAVACELVSADWLTRRRAASVAWAVALLTTFLLVLLHPKLAGMLDFATQQVANPEQFYSWHRLYLCTATAQWFAGGVLLVLLQLGSVRVKE